jgi:hypothetical protein
MMVDTHDLNFLTVHVKHASRGTFMARVKSNIWRFVCALLSDPSRAVTIS